MKILFSPQRSDQIIDYEFNGESITVSLNGESDTFDFTDMPNGKLEGVETSLSINPIISAERADGVLYVQLLKFIGAEATEEERFPEWQEV